MVTTKTEVEWGQGEERQVWKDAMAAEREHRRHLMLVLLPQMGSQTFELLQFIRLTHIIHMDLMLASFPGTAMTFLKA